MNSESQHVVAELQGHDMQIGVNDPAPADNSIEWETLPGEQLETQYILNRKHLGQGQGRNEVRVYFIRMRLGMGKVRGRRKRDLWSPRMSQVQSNQGNPGIEHTQV